MGNVKFSCLLPDDCYHQIQAICAKRGWTRGAYLMSIVDNCVPIDDFRYINAPHIKRADCPHTFEAMIDPHLASRIEKLRGFRSWSRRDMVINLTDYYLTTKMQGE